MRELPDGERNAEKILQKMQREKKEGLIMILGLSAIIGLIAPKIVKYFSVDIVDARRYAKYLIYLTSALVLLIVLLVVGFWLRGCYIDRQIDKTAEKINKIKIEEAKIESQVKAADTIASDKEKEAVIKEKKAEVFEQAVKEIEFEKGVDTKTATQNLCEAYRSTNGNRELPEICR